MEKIILYYKFVPVSDPEMVRLWQLELCSRLGLKGRVIISRHGINGTLGGPLDSLRAYKSAMNKTNGKAKPPGINTRCSKCKTINECEKPTYYQMRQESVQGSFIAVGSEKRTQ